MGQCVVLCLQTLLTVALGINKLGVGTVTHLTTNISLGGRNVCLACYSDALGRNCSLIGYSGIGNGY